MSFYRMFIAAVAAMSLATAVFANEENANASQQPEATQAVQVADSGRAAEDQVQAKVDLNKATVKQLAKVKGLSMAKARSIVSYRKKHGDFKSLDDLKMVKGFKKMDEKTMKEIQDQLTIG